LKCSYCFQLDQPDASSRMTFDTTKKVIDHLLVHTKDPKLPIPTIGFFGGEPMLCWDLVVQTVSYMQGVCSPRKPHFSMTTNGVLLTAEKAKFLVDSGFSFIVSIDGPKELHNKYRVYPDGTGSFDQVMRGLTYLKDAGVKNVTLRATYASGEEFLVERLEFLNQLCDQGYGHWVSVEPVCLTEGHCAHNIQGYTLEAVQNLGNEFLRAAKWASERLRNGKPARYHILCKQIERLLYTTHSVCECGAGMGYMSVTPDGSLHSCHRTQFTKIGDLEQGIDEELRAKWSDSRSYCRVGCNECFAQWACGGGCRECSLGDTGDIHVPYKIGCEFVFRHFEAAAYVMSEVPGDTLRKFIADPTKDLCKVCGKPKKKCEHTEKPVEKESE